MPWLAGAASEPDTVAQSTRQIPETAFGRRSAGSIGWTAFEGTTERAAATAQAHQVTTRVSSSRTEDLPSADNRLARTQPADPAPMIT